MKAQIFPTQRLYWEFLLMSLLLAGCTTITIDEYRANPMRDQMHRTRNSFLELGATPLTNEVEISHYFGINLMERGVLPVHIQLKNIASNRTYIVRKENFTLYQTSKESRALKDLKMVANAEAPAVVATAFATLAPGLGLAAYLGAGKIVTDASVVEHNMTEKEFLTTTLTPGEAVSGFVYFQLPKEVHNNGFWTLRLTARDPVNRQEVFIDLPVGLKQQEEMRK